MILTCIIHVVGLYVRIYTKTPVTTKSSLIVSSDTEPTEMTNLEAPKKDNIDKTSGTRMQSILIASSDTEPIHKDGEDKARNNQITERNLEVPGKKNINVNNEDQALNNQINEKNLTVSGEGNTNNANKFLICPRLSNQLGSHMFTFATSLGIAHALNYKLIIQPSDLLLKYFELNQTIGDSLENVEKLDITQWRQNTWNRTILSRNLTLEGWWRNWKCFKNVSDDIRKSFTIKSEFLNKSEQFIRSIKPDNKTLIGIHVRRGSYLREDVQRMGKIVVNKDYISKAMDFYRRRYRDARFVVVSNDIKWCMDNISGKDVFFSNFTEPILDMGILSLCDHTILSVGTFSWWGGWLSRGTVVYCSDYPRSGSHLAKNVIIPEDYYPPSWIGMTNGN